MVPTKKPNLTDTQLKIILTLEEAGEDNFAALVNTILPATGKRLGVEFLSEALKALLHHGLIQVATARDPASQAWVPLPTDISRNLLDELQHSLHWNDEEDMWEPTDPRRTAEVLLTAFGQEMARSALRGRNWH